MHMLHTMITASNPHFRGKISSLLEELLAAAVTEICELFDNEFANVTLRAECPRCKHSKEVEKRSHSTPHRNNSSGDVHRFTSRDEDAQRGCSRGEYERNTNADAGAQQTTPQCSQWDMGANNEHSKHGNKEMGTKIELLSIKQEVVEESDFQTDGDDGQEGVTGSDIALPDPTLDMSTSLSPRAGPQWLPHGPYIHADGNCEAKFESENSHSSSTNKDEVSENSGHGCLDHYLDQQQTSLWVSDMAAGPHHQDEAQGEDVDLGSSLFSRWSVSPLRNQAYLHKQWPRSRKPPGPVSACNVSLSGAVSLDVRTVGSGNQLHSPLTLTADQERRFTCPICGKRLLSEQTLKSHQKVHTGYAPHQCNQCGKRFSRLENLKVHQNIHTGLKPYTCKFCLKKFNAPSNFNRHKRACLKRKLAQFSS
ncbi:zinc finger protein 90-like [Alosa alosa]|uniref:zinc finger protein 90-like n=2 Tax=Alosa TaxID=34772 RepID=UPI001C08087F|nr:zinc finger protein 90-like isoform X1 [Alosa sapidissima]XP_048122535.1 zinc finger protein 90-like [Alosa alosa]